MPTTPELSLSEAVRKRLLDAIPSSYSPLMHLAGTTGVGLAALGVSVLGMSALKPIELLVVPATLLVANGFEWRVHKHVLHRKFWPFEEIYQKHTPEHHMVYHEHTMAMREMREYKLVLIPALGVFGIVLATAPMAGLVGAALGSNAGFLFLATASTYMVSYELLHLAYHLPEDHPIGKSPLIAFLRKHHAKHHDPRLMQKFNFNVTVPLFDLIMGTYKGAGDDVVAEQASEGAAAA